MKHSNIKNYALQISEDLDKFPLRNSQNIGGTWVGHFSDKSAKHPLSIGAGNLFNPRQVLTADGEYIQVLRKIISCIFEKVINVTKVYHWVVVSLAGAFRLGLHCIYHNSAGHSPL
jgi:hypothetical protein